MDGLIENAHTLWPLSVIFAATFGWAAGRGHLTLSPAWRRLRKMANAAWQAPVPAEPLAIAKRRQTARIKRSRHPFHNMPPVDIVRAQARAICEAECVWDAPDIAVQITALIAGPDEPRSDNPAMPPEQIGLKKAA